MAQFRGTVCGTSGEASRLGSKKSGLTVTANGWDVGATVELEHVDGVDVVRVYATSGSSSRGTKILLQSFCAGDLWEMDVAQRTPEGLAV